MKITFGSIGWMLAIVFGASTVVMAMRVPDDGGYRERAEAAEHAVLSLRDQRDSLIVLSTENEVAADSLRTAYSDLSERMFAMRDSLWDVIDREAAAFDSIMQQALSITDNPQVATYIAQMNESHQTALESSRQDATTERRQRLAAERRIDFLEQALLDARFLHETDAAIIDTQAVAINEWRSGYMSLEQRLKVAKAMSVVGGGLTVTLLVIAIFF